jgi:spermidine synthase
MRFALGAALVAGSVAVFLLPAWDHKIMSGGVAIYAPRYAQDSTSAWREFMGRQDLLYHRDGISATVAVFESSGLTVLVVNGKSDASSSLDPRIDSDLPTQLMSGHLPALLHSDPKTALVIGLGSGITVGALAQYPLQKIDVAEIEPAVIEASAFFAEANRHALSDPRVRQAVADGRNFLLTTDDQYDIIVSEPSNPWIRGMATLFTVEFFALARQHLNADGVMVQWIQAYSMAPEDFRMVVASFQTAFPHATLWATLKGDFLLIGTSHPLAVDLDRIRAHYASSQTLRQDLKRIKLASPEAIFSNFYLNEDELRRFATGAILNTDDRLPLEFSAPKNLYRDTTSLNFDALRAVKTSMFPPLQKEMLETVDRPVVHVDLAIGFIAKRLPEEALRHLNRALAQNPEYGSALILRGWTYGGTNRFPEALQDLQTALRINPQDAAAHHQLGLLYLDQKMVGEGIESLRLAVSLAPDKERYQFDLAMATRQPLQTPTTLPAAR